MPALVLGRDAEACDIRELASDQAETLTSTSTSHMLYLGLAVTAGAKQPTCGACSAHTPFVAAGCMIGVTVVDSDSLGWQCCP